MIGNIHESKDFLKMLQIERDRIDFIIDYLHGMTMEEAREYFKLKSCRENKMSQKVWVVLRSIAYEGDDLLVICDSETRAEGYKQELSFNEPEDKYLTYKIEEFTINEPKT